jgi:hypothetical protein
MLIKPSLLLPIINKELTNLFFPSRKILNIKTVSVVTGYPELSAEKIIVPINKTNAESRKSADRYSKHDLNLSATISD